MPCFATIRDLPGIATDALAGAGAPAARDQAAGDCSPR